MIKRYGIPGILEYRRYSFGGVYIIIGRRLILTLKRGSISQN